MINMILPATMIPKPSTLCTILQGCHPRLHQNKANVLKILKTKTSGVLKANWRKLMIIIETDWSICKLMFWDQLSFNCTSILRVA